MLVDRIRALLACLLLLGASMTMGGATAAAQAAGDAPGLSSFANDTMLRAFLQSIVAEQRRRNVEDHGSPFPLPPPPPPPPAPSAPGAASAPNVTNTQISGVDEGDIVKRHGDTLVILRRGRLLTVSLAGGSLRPVAAIDAYPPGVDGRGDWYDEMLVSGDRVVVIGYSYRRGGTQVNRFRIDGEGHLAFEDSYQLRSGDYYSSRNYASRLIGSRLILYSPLNLPLEGDVLQALPAMRQWEPGAVGGSWRRIANATHFYVPNVLREVQLANLGTLHSVTTCDLAAASLACDATVVVGNYSRTFFVSNNAIYLWIGSVWKQPGRGADSMVYRIPFDSSRPSAVRARGTPVDQFSFHPDAARGTLDVLVRAEGGGDAMWGPEVTSGDPALLRIPMAAFGSGANEVPLDRYQRLPKPVGNHWNFQNRFVRDHLLYGVASSGGAGNVTVVSLADRSVRALPIAHGVDRLDAIGGDAIAIGSGEGFLGFTAVQLSPAGAELGETFRLADAREGEARSHGFFFRPDPDSADGSSGLLGLPVAKVAPTADVNNFRQSAAILFLNRRGGRLSQAGELASRSVAAGENDNCVASCVDWYGNARPIFLGERMFALLGYELVEGSRRGDHVDEVGRVDFAPHTAPPPRAQ